MTVSPSACASGFAPLSTLIPGMTPFEASSSGNGVPSSAFWRIVSSKRMTPLMYSSAPGVVKRRLRYARRFSSVDSTPIVSKRFLIVPVALVGGEDPLPLGDERARRSRAARCSACEISSVLASLAVWGSHYGRVQSPQPADVAQLVEHWLPKPRVAGSSPVVRFEKALETGFSLARVFADLLVCYGRARSVRGRSGREKACAPRVVLCPSWHEHHRHPSGARSPARADPGSRRNRASHLQRRPDPPHHGRPRRRRACQGEGDVDEDEVERSRRLRGHGWRPVSPKPAGLATRSGARQDCRSGRDGTRGQWRRRGALHPRCSQRSSAGDRGWLVGPLPAFAVSRVSARSALRMTPTSITSCSSAPSTGGR